MASQAQQLRSRRTLLAAEEGDPVLYTEENRERKNPLKVMDVGGNAEEGHYLVVRGPQGGTYTIREDPMSGKLLYDDSKKRVTNLRFSDVSDDVQASHREMREGAVNRTYELLASGDYDYSEVEAAVADAVGEEINQADDSDVRAVLLGASADPDPEAFGGAPFGDEGGRLAYASLFAEAVEEAGEYSGSGAPETRLNGNEEFEMILREGVVMLRSAVNVRGEANLEDQAYQVSQDICDRLSTADHIEIIENIPATSGRNQAIPYGDRERAYELALARLQREIIEEFHSRERVELIGDKQRKRLDEFFGDVEEEPVDTDELMEEVQPTVPNLPLMPDEGMPHTTVDEANYFFGTDIPIVAGEWTLADSGIVLDNESRKLVWKNNDGLYIIIAGSNQGAANRWRTILMNDHLAVLYDGKKFERALSAATDYMQPDGERPTVRVIEEDLKPDGGIVVEQNIDHENLGRRILSQDGFFSEAFGAIFDASKKGASLVGGGLLFVAGRFWAKYDEKIAELVVGSLVTVLIANSSKILLGSESGVEYSVDEADAKVYTRYDRGGLLNFEVEQRFPTFFKKGKRAATFALGLNQEQGEELITAAMGGVDAAQAKRKIGVTGGTRGGITLPQRKKKSSDSGGKKKPMGSSNKPKTKPKHSGQQWKKPEELGGMSPKEAADIDAETWAERLGVDESEVDRARSKHRKGKILNAKGSSLVDKLEVGATLVDAAKALAGDDMAPGTAEEVVDEAKDADRNEQLEMPANETDVDEDQTSSDTGRSFDERMADVSQDEVDQWEELSQIHEEAEAVRSFQGEESTTGQFNLGEALDRVHETRERGGPDLPDAEEEAWQEEQRRKAEEAEEWADREGFWEDEDSDPAEWE